MDSYKGRLKGYWRRHSYHRVDGGREGFSRRRRLVRAELGGEGEERSRLRRRGRFWRIKIPPRLAFLRAASPRRILSRIRDAYVRMMLRLSGAVTCSAYGYGGDVTKGFAPPPLKEYDERVLVEIYKSIIAASARAGGAAGATVALPRPVDVLDRFP